MKLPLFVLLANAALVFGSGGTDAPTDAPTVAPSVKPTVVPTVEPSVKPTVVPTVEPSVKPTVLPTIAPTVLPTILPTLAPTVLPTLSPTLLPTLLPTLSPTVTPTLSPTLLPTIVPTITPTVTPTITPTVTPTVVPTITPTVIPTITPTVTPTVVPTIKPTVVPTIVPTISPTVVPTIHPTIKPTVVPSEVPTQPPSHHPTISGPGWFLESYYTNDSSTDPVVVYGTRTQTCLAVNSNFESDYWYKYSCGDGYVQFQLYSDAACTVEENEGEVSFDFDQDGEGLPFNFHRGFYYFRVWYLALTHIQFECVDDAGLYTFAENQKYAVTEYYPTDGTENDEAEQCDVDYTQFAAYQKGYCFGFGRYVEYEEGPSYGDFHYWKFSASDDTFISLTAFSTDTCSYAEGEEVTSYGNWRAEGGYFVHNIFPVDQCNANFYQSYDSDVASKQLVEEKPKMQIQNHATNPLKFDSSTPSVMKKLMTESRAKAKNEPVVSLEAHVKEYNEKKMAEFEATYPKKAAAMKKAHASMVEKKASSKDAQYIEPPRDYYYNFYDVSYDAHPESGNVYFTDDDRDDDASGYYHDDEFIPGINAAQILSEYYQWKNVPAVEGAPAPASWFTEVIEGYDDESESDVPILISTRHTLTCMAYTENEEVYFNYQIVCGNNFVHILYYDWNDYQCEGDYIIYTRSQQDFLNYGDDLGRREIDSDDYFYECSDSMFSSDWAEATADNTYATEFFYPLSGYGYNNETESYGYIAEECPVSEDTTDVTMGVAILQDWCFTFSSFSSNTYFSAKYWVYDPVVENNQNIQFSVWEGPACRDKWVTETKQIDIWTCSNEQQNSVYQSPTFYDAKKKDSKDVKKSEKEVMEATKALMDFEKHDTMKTPFNTMLKSKLPKAMKAKQQKAMKKRNAKKNGQKQIADVKVENVYDDYYYYYDQGSTFFNNRVSFSNNQWFSFPATATLAPSETPSQVPSEHPTIEPTMAPNPPTLRPTPAAGMPTASPTHQVTYTFSVVQNLNGIDATTFNADPNNGAVFEEAVAMAMPPLTADNIQIADVVNAETVRRLRGLLIDGAEVDITYWVTYTVAETGYNDAETAYDALTASLNTAVVETDLFDGYISVLAPADNGDAPDLLDTTSDAAEASDVSQVGTDDDSKPNTDNHHKIIVGVLVGLGGGLLLICIIAFCIFGRGEESHTQSYSNPQSVEMTGVDPTTNKGAI